VVRVLHDLQLQLSSPLPSYLASVKPANPDSTEKMAVEMERERERQRELWTVSKAATISRRNR